MSDSLENLDARYWGETIICHPELEKQCPWSKLSPSSWHDILLEHPEFIRNAPKMITQSFMTINQWLEVLTHHPELDAYFPAGKALLDKDSDAIGQLWATLLSHHPLFEKYNPWKHLRREDWARLLCQQPQFIEKYQNERCLRNTRQFTLSSKFIAEIISRQPSLFEAFDKTPFTSCEWKDILLNQPQFINDCKINKLDALSLGQLLARHPEWLSRCATYSLEPKDILLVAENYPEILNHCDLEKFNNYCEKSSGFRDTPWMEKHPRLVPYSDWNFSPEYWDALLSRLSHWMKTGKKAPVFPFGNGNAKFSRLNHKGSNANKSEHKEKNLRNSLNSILDIRFMVDKGGQANLGKIPRHLRAILNDNNLTYEQLMLKMSMLTEEDCGWLFFGLLIQNREDDLLDRLLYNDVSMTVQMVPLQYLLPIAIMYFPVPQLGILFLHVTSHHGNDAIAKFRDSAGNNVLHYAFFKAPWHPETQAGEWGAELFHNLYEYGVDPDAPNNMGFSYRQICQELENYLLGKK